MLRPHFPLALWDSRCYYIYTRRSPYSPFLLGTVLCLFVHFFPLHNVVLRLLLHLPAAARTGPSAFSLFIYLLISTRYLRVTRNVIAPEKQIVQLELITSFAVFPPHLALISFIAISFCCGFYLFMSRGHPRDIHMHTLCRKLLKDCHPIYPGVRADQYLLYTLRMPQNCQLNDTSQGLVEIIPEPSIFSDSLHIYIPSLDLPLPLSYSLISSWLSNQNLKLSKTRKPSFCSISLAKPSSCQ